MSIKNHVNFTGSNIKEVYIESSKDCRSTIQQNQEKPDTVQPVTETDAIERNSKAPRGAVYQQRGKPPHVLILCNFEKELKGFAKDVQSLKDMWKKFGCKVTLEKDLSATAMDLIIHGFVEKLTGEEYFVAVFVLSHGDKEDVVDGADNVKLSVSTIVGLFNNKITKLQHMPKLFFFQTCRGTNIDDGVNNVQVAFRHGTQPPKLPLVSDTLVMFPTQKDEYAYVPGTGSWFIQILVETFLDFADKEHLVDLLTMVNDKMSEQEVQQSKNKSIIGAKAMSEFISTLRRKLYILQQ